MKYRKLRITFSTECGVMCVLLVALWVQNYYEIVFLFKRLATTNVSLQTYRGKLGFWVTAPQLVQSTSPDTTWGIGRRRLI